MALPEILLTPGQQKVMDKLAVGVKQAQARVRMAQEQLAIEVEALEEYALQSAEKLQISISDYGFDLASGKFVDKVTLQAETDLKKPA